jgi:hypothetical protein
MLPVLFWGDVGYLPIYPQPVNKLSTLLLIENK